MELRSIVLGCGGYLPERVVSNAELAERLDTSDAWIVQRTGIHQRHVAAPGELTSDLAVRAAERALVAGGRDAAEIDLVVLATATPDNTFPATATKVAARLGVRGGVPAFDVQAVCTGFIYALATADNFLRLGQSKRALVIGAETFSRILDWEERGTCVLFGDGAGAVVLEAQESRGGPDARGVLSTHLHADGSGYELLYVDGGPSSTGTAGFLRMEGREIFRHAVDRLAGAVGEAFTANHLTPAALDWLVPHQANRRIIDGVARKLGLPANRVVVTIDRHANTSAASVPLALAEASSDGRIRPGQLVLLEAMGGGLTWGAALVRW
ncbi:MAG TPA: beta-ketoacyl-ACP synthase III [Stellaceae bacterium]|nr:beta-ketoacyl-ACP synthase III [Stellaceae bacterium]